VDMELHTPFSKFKKALEGKIIATAKTIGVFERM